MAERRGKGDDGGAKEPSRLNCVTAPANGHGKLGRLDGDFVDMGMLAQGAEDGIGEPGIGLKVSVEGAVKERRREQGVKQGEPETEIEAEAKDGAAGRVPGEKPRS